MNIIDTAKAMVERREITDGTTNLMFDACSAMLGDPISIGKIIVSLTKYPFLIREQVFWGKFEMFLCGVYADEKDRAGFSKKISKDGLKKENSLRLVECIDRAETKNKIKFLINASSSLAADFISLTDYFRICHAITMTLEEDLIFLSTHIDEKELTYNYSVQGLQTSGLMYQSVIDANGSGKYSFTSTAQMVDRFAVGYENVDRHPDPTSEINNIDPRVNVNLPTTTKNEIDAIVDEKAKSANVRVDKMQKQIDSNPTVYFGKETPPNAKNGDFWLDLK